MKPISIDLFSGMGGLTEGLRKAGFRTALAFEIDESASKAYRLNHTETEIIVKDIRKVDIEEVKLKLNGETIHLLAGCPPCQGFSSIRRLNKPKPIRDKRNTLINEFVRFVEELKPYTFMMENVPGLALHGSFRKAKKRLEKKLGYHVDYNIVNVKDYGVPQNRKRLVMIGSRLGEIKVASPTKKNVTVRQKIGSLPEPDSSKDRFHKMFPKHTDKILQLIGEIPKDGGSRKDLGEEKQLKCHLKENVGFCDVYGRLRWDDYSTTITGGCLNPSKGRFLHPEQNRCISAREAALLQSFRKGYKLPTDVPISKLALMIGNALPPEFCAVQAKNIKRHLEQYLHG